MDKYIEIDGLGEVVPRSEYDVLMAQLEQLQSENSDLMLYAYDAERWFNEHDPNGYISPKRSRAKNYLAARDAEIKAKAVEDAIKATSSNKYPLPLRDVCDLYEYANQLRQQAKVVL